jgi:hypothetical protein
VSSTPILRWGFGSKSALPSPDGAMLQTHPWYFLPSSPRSVSLSKRKHNRIAKEVHRAHIGCGITTRKEKPERGLVTKLARNLSLAVLADSFVSSSRRQFALLPLVRCQVYPLFVPSRVRQTFRQIPTSYSVSYSHLD